MCPVCRARFRGSRECSRCGADLTTIMTLAATAWRMRKAARQALFDGDLPNAGVLANAAESICQSASGKRLAHLSSCLAVISQQEGHDNAADRG